METQGNLKHRIVNLNGTGNPEKAVFFLPIQKALQGNVQAHTKYLCTKKP